MAEHGSIDRRDFLKTAAAAGFLITSAKTAFGSEANSKVELGLVGCGNRGAWIGHLFQENSPTKVVGLHDYFKDRVDSAGERLDVGESRRYIGFDGYQELIASGVDAVAVESPPYFHPEQTVAALEAGKHVYLAKPIAVDVPGCMAIVEAAEKHQAKVSCLVDFQTRNDALFREAAKRIHDGMIGDVVSGQAYYICNRLGIKTEPGTEAARLRNWVFDQALSGDIIVEQNIHVLDVANWFVGDHPVRATGHGGLQARTDIGDTWDHYAVAYEYPNNVLINFTSGQYPPGYTDLCTRVYGVVGTCDAHYGGEVWINSKSDRWQGGETSDIYRQGAVNNIVDFVEGIQNGELLNNAREAANSTLTSILGRMAAHGGEPMTWDAMMADDTRLDAELDLSKDATHAFV